MAKKKYYTIWRGRKTGVFNSWEECQPLVDGFDGAKYKSFPSREEALEALEWSHQDHIGQSRTTKISTLKSHQIIVPSISVDGAWNTVTGDCEYQWVDTETGKRLFHSTVFRDGTNNIVEFLALVHALAYCHEKGLSLPIYSDSRTALAWVRKKHANTKQPKSDKNKVLFDLMDRAIVWLNSHQYNNLLLKWETNHWGEIPADFGRK